MTDPNAPYHMHIYFRPEQQGVAEALQRSLNGMKDAGIAPDLLYVGSLRQGKVGPHPISQFEIHFPHRGLAGIQPIVQATGLLALIHPLTDDDLADHTTLGTWINGDPLDLDLSVLDPPGVNQGVARYGKTDF